MLWIAGVACSSASAHGPLHDQLASLTKQIEQQPRNAEVRYRRAKLYHLHGDNIAAHSDYQRALVLDPDLHMAHLRLAELHLDNDESSRALLEVNCFLAVEPNNAHALFLRGTARMVLGHGPAAVNDLDRAIALMEQPTPQHYVTRARLTLGALDGSSGLRRAVAGLDDGMRRIGMVATMQLEAADLERRFGAYDSALTRLEALSSQYARQDLMLVRRAELFESAGRMMEAEVLYTEALEIILELPPHARNTAATQELEVFVRSKLVVGERGAP